MVPVGLYLHLADFPPQQIILIVKDDAFGRVISRSCGSAASPEVVVYSLGCTIITIVFHCPGVFLQFFFRINSCSTVFFASYTVPSVVKSPNIRCISFIAHVYREPLWYSVYINLSDATASQRAVSETKFVFSGRYAWQSERHVIARAQYGDVVSLVIGPIDDWPFYDEHGVLAE